MIRYAFDDLHRLVVRNPADRLRPTRVLEGRVTVDRRNRLVYRVDSAAAQNGDPGPHAINLDGTWSLARNHTLALAVREQAAGRRQRLYLKGAIVEAKAHALTVALSRHEVAAKRSTQRVTLNGRWQADAKNRLTFLAQKADGTSDRLTFRGGWHVGPRHEILYRYRLAHRTRRTRRAQHQHTMRVAGAWDVTQTGRLVYRVEGASDSTLAFRASLQSSTLRAREGRVAYQVGIGVSRGRTLKRRVTLFGRWKLNRDLSVSFEIPYVDGHREAGRFHARLAPGQRRSVTAQLRDRAGRPIGLSVVWSRKMLDDAEVFVRVGKSGKATEALAGVAVKF